MCFSEITCWTESILRKTKTGRTVACEHVVVIYCVLHTSQMYIHVVTVSDTKSHWGCGRYYGRGIKYLSWFYLLPITTCNQGRQYTQFYTVYLSCYTQFYMILVACFSFMTKLVSTKQYRHRNNNNLFSLWKVLWSSDKVPLLILSTSYNNL